jgi:hypothetical protein
MCLLSPYSVLDIEFNVIGSFSRLLELIEIFCSLPSEMSPCIKYRAGPSFAVDVKNNSAKSEK